MWTIPASSQPNEADLPRPCSAFPRFCELITLEAGRTGLDPRLVDAVIKVESDYRPDAIGAAGEIDASAPIYRKALGFWWHGSRIGRASYEHSTRSLYLAKAWSLAHGDFCRALMKYRAGHGEEQMTSLSVNYCHRAREHLSVQGSSPWLTALSAVKECKAKRLSGKLTLMSNRRGVPTPA